jgi:hypothetical protein
MDGTPAIMIAGVFNFKKEMACPVTSNNGQSSLATIILLDNNLQILY